MTPEEQQRTIDFILTSQASFFAGMEELKEEDKRLAARIEELREENKSLSRSLKDQKKTVYALVRVTNNLVKISTEVVDRIKRVEARSDNPPQTS